MQLTPSWENKRKQVVDRQKKLNKWDTMPLCFKNNREVALNLACIISTARQ